MGEQMFGAFVIGNAYDLVSKVVFHDEWEKFPELLLIESKFVAQLHDELFNLVDANEMDCRVSALQHASSYLEQCVLGYAKLTEKPYPSVQRLKTLRDGCWGNWHQFQEQRHEQHKREYTCLSLALIHHHRL